VIAKDIHVASVVATFTLFFVRGVWMILDSKLSRHPWARRVPPVIDTILLASAIVLSLTIRQYPFVNGWLTAKVLALFVYIGLGMLALSYGKTRTVRIGAWIAAQLTFFYIVAVATTKTPLVLM